MYKFTLAAVHWQVCRKFKQLFEQNPKLSQWMVLPEAFAASSLPSALKWLHLFGSAVQWVSCTFNAAAQAVLTPLSWPGSPFHTICIHMFCVLYVGLTSLTLSFTCVIIGWNVWGFDMKFMWERAVELGVQKGFGRRKNER